ncbi:hypothetical protein [Wolbachia sp. wLmal]|uniref:hypothetical protein n=1 Tax=Wolbachia sp. wLmal TaxID=3342489 RepID=UPI003C301009
MTVVRLAVIPVFDTGMTGKDAGMKVFQIVDKPKSIITICLFSRLCKKSTE